MATKQPQTNSLQMLRTAIREKNTQRLYFFHGEETFLMNHYLEQLRKLLIDDVTESFNFHKLNGENFDIQTLADAVENLPMMAESTMVWVDEIDLFKMPEADREKMIDIFSDVPDYCTLVFTYVTTPWKPDKRQKKLWDAVERYGTVVEFPKQEQRDLVAWIARHFAAEKKSISQELCVYLIDITGGTMTALASEISKICAYSEADAICRADIDAVVEPVLDAVVFQMTDLLSRNAYGPALQKLRQLFKMQQEPIAILGTISAHFRRLGIARTLLDNGKTSVELMRLCNMQDYPARKTMSAAGRFSASFYARVAEEIMETDRQMKTSYDEPERLLEMLVMQIAQEARND